MPPAPWSPRAAAPRLPDMEHTPTKEALEHDLDLLLRESDREDPILPEPHDPERPEEEIDSLILAGLVHP